jgi:ubiquinone/menaquinone biosynthesis C-methylase UbiE
MAEATLSDRVHFGLMSIVHETLYGLFRDPLKALSAAGLEPGQRVLEVGCGPGFFTVPAARMVGAQGVVYALDISPLALARVQEKVDDAKVANVKTILADAARTGLPEESFDLVFVFGFRHAAGDMEGIRAELYRLLKPAGVLATEGELWHPGGLFRPLQRRGRIFQYRKVDQENGKPSLRRDAKVPESDVDRAS